MDLVKLKKMSECRLDMAKHALDKFITEFGKDPIHALNWVAGKFDAAGQLFIHTIILDTLNDEKGSDLEKEDYIKNTLENYALQSLGFSSSPTANLMEMAKQQAAAKMLKDIKYL